MTTSLGKTYSSYSGQDIRIIVNGVFVGNITSLSYQIQRMKQGNYIMGNVDPVSFARGKRQITGVLKGITMDTDLLSHRAFDNEAALLDKDEIFYGENKQINRTERKKISFVSRPKYPNLKPLEPKRNKFEHYIFLFKPSIPNVGQPPELNDAIQGCLESLIETALQGAALAIITGGLGSIAIAYLIFDGLKDCLGGIIEETIIEGGLFGFIVNLGASIYYYLEQDMYSTYERNYAQLESKYLKKSKEVIIEEKTEIIVEETESLNYENYSFIKNRQYDVGNLTNNYSAARVEYLDQILPFDIVIVGVNEYGQSAQMRMYGVEALGESKSLSIDQLTVNYEVPFIARTILPWRSFDLQV
jgi:hypothetical protein